MTLKRYGLMKEFLRYIACFLRQCSLDRPGSAWSGGRRASGSMSLAMIFTTSAGVLFLLLFLNLSRYVAARGAVREAARKTARCITPSDPECVSIDFGSGSALSQQWFGYSSADAGRRAVDLFIPRYRYTAEMIEEVWQGSFNTYEIHRVNQPARLTHYEVPLQRYRALGPYVIPGGVVNARFAIRSELEFAPKYQPNFPSFVQDASTPIEDWLLQQLPIEFVNPAPAGFGASIILPGETAEFFVKPTLVPLLSAFPETPCAYADGAACNGAELAGDSIGAADAANWQKYAYVALKVFAKVQSLGPGRASVQWHSSDLGAGLFIDV